ncbi:hypothetical protein BgiMline_003579 [Biomphalaria glabrata]|nr:hypothetical protein BgiMline_012117 [Biomphalaria glabrata]
MELLLLLNFAHLFRILWTFEAKEVDEGLQWNYRGQSWLEFHVKHCGRYCVGSKLQKINKVCETFPRCFKCDCDPVCFIYDTCCPLLVNNSYEEPSFHTVKHLPNPDRFLCQRIQHDSKKRAYYIISDCDPTFVPSSKKISKTMWSMSQLCANPNTGTLDDITPYSDIYYGIVYSNKFCAMCNGYLINDNTTYDTSNITLKIASPWTIEILSEHYQRLYHFTNEYEFFFAAAKSPICKITFDPPQSKILPKKCTRSKISNYVCTNQGSVETQLCQNLPRRKYLRDGPRGNIFCSLCDGFNDLPCILKSNDEGMSGPHGPSGHPSYRIPPIALLLAMKKIIDFEAIDLCTTELEWMDYQVVCLNRVI